MQANGISSVSTNGGGLASPETNGQTAAPYSAEDRGINGAQDTQQAQEQAAEQTQAQPQRRRLVQGRPSHGRVVSDTNSDLSSASSDEQASDSDFGEYGSKEANGNRPQVAMKAPRANPAAAAASIADRQAPQQQATAQRVSNFIDDEDDESSVSEMSVVSEDADFTMSGVDDIEEDLESSSESSALEDDSSDGNWGSKARKRKPKKTKAGATNKRAKNGGRKGSRGGSSANASQHGTPRVAAKTRGGYYSDSDDSDFLGGGRRKTKLKRGARAAATKKTKGGVPAYLGGSDSEAGSSDYRSVRQSSRGGGVKSYAEDQGDYPGVDFEDSADEEIEPKAKAAAKQAQPLIDEDTGEDIIEQVRDFRLSEKAGDTRMDNIDNLEFFIKWKGWSYRHATWDTAAFLRDYKGYKKVENYFKGTVLVDNAIRNDPATTREDIEQLDINREMERDTLRDYTKVERVVASRPLASARRVREGDGAAAATATQTDGDGDGVEYLVKWRRLPYSACSWVAADELGAEAQAELDAFLDRSQSQQVPHRSASTSKAKRPKFQRLTQQPAYLAGGELREYQLTSLNWMAHLWSNDENGILADEMGLGKTVQTVSFLSYLFHTQHVYGPFLVVVPLSTIGSWQREFVRWAPDMNVVCYIDDNRSRAVMREYEFYAAGRVKLNVLLTTYELVLKDRAVLGQVRWEFLAVDEAHRLKNAESQLHEALAGFHTTNRLLVTGTPLQNTVKELVTLCRFLSPLRFGDLDGDFDIGAAAADGEQSGKIADLHRRLKPYMLRRLKRDVEKALPSRTERILRVELSAMQVHYYKNILTRNYAALSRGSGGSGGAQMSLLNVLVELKKASNHPYLFPGAEPEAAAKDAVLRGLVDHSGKMVLLDKLLAKLKAGGHRVLVFSQMVRMLDILADYMALRGYAFQRLDGSVASEERKRAIEHFNAPGSPDFAFLLSTRAGGLGINLETADTVVLYDSDFNPQADMQAMARAHRIGQKRQVSVYRFVSKNTVEEDILERAKRKMVLEYCVIKGMDTSGLHVTDTERRQMERAKQGKAGASAFSRDELAAILKFGASSMFADDGPTKQQRRLDDMDLDAMLADAEQAETSEAGVADDFLSQFKVADYGGGGGGPSWDEIIPEDERLRAEEEAEQRAAEELLFQRRRRTRVSYAEDGTVLDGASGHSSDASSSAGSTRARRRGGGGGSGGGTGGTSRRRAEGRSSDPRALGEKEVRALIRGVQKFGSPEHRFAEVVGEAELGGKDPEAVRALGVELLRTCEDALRSHLQPGEGDSAAGDSEDLVGGVRRSARAILVTFRGVHSVNAGVVMQRVTDLAVLGRRLAHVSAEDATKFRIGVPLKPVHHWSCLWGQREDAMLLVGIHRHGFGNWDRIQADGDLGLQAKLFLTPADEQAAGAQAIGAGAKRIVAPKATHLVRRGEYLLKVLRDAEEAKPRARRARSAESDANANVGVGQPADAEGRMAAEDSGSESMDERACKDLMRPVKKYLQRLRDESDNLTSVHSKVQLISDCLLPIGRHIRDTVRRHADQPGASDSLHKHLWIFVTYFWRNPVHHAKLQRLFGRLEEKHMASPEAVAAADAVASPESAAALGSPDLRLPSEPDKVTRSSDRHHHPARSARSSANGNGHSHSHAHSHGSSRSSGVRPSRRESRRQQ